MPRAKSHLHDWPSLNRWLYSLSFTDSDIQANFYYSALVDYFPGSLNGSHLVPTPDEISKERPRLKQTLLNFNPDVVVPIGALSISYCLNQKPQPLTSTLGQIYFADPYLLLDKIIPIVPLPHPSGASTWHHSPEHKLLLSNSLNLLLSNIT